MFKKCHMSKFKKYNVSNRLEVVTFQDWEVSYAGIDLSFDIGEP